MVSENYTTIHHNMYIIKVIKNQVAPLLFNNLKMWKHILEVLIQEAFFAPEVDGVFLGWLLFNESIKKRLLFDICNGFEIVEPFLGVEVDYFVEGVIFPLIEERLRIQDTDLFAKLCYILFDKLSIDLQGKHQVGKNTLGESESLPTLKCVFKLGILFLTLIKLKILLVTYGQ